MPIVILLCLAFFGSVTAALMPAFVGGVAIFGAFVLSGALAGLAGFVRTIEMLESTGRLDRNVEGLDPGDVLLRRGAEGRGLTRPELAVVLSMAKLTLQSAAEELTLADDPTMDIELMAAFPPGIHILANEGDFLRPAVNKCPRLIEDRIK